MVKKGIVLHHKKNRWGINGIITPIISRFGEVVEVADTAGDGWDIGTINNNN